MAIVLGTDLSGYLGYFYFSPVFRVTASLRFARHAGPMRMDT